MNPYTPGYGKQPPVFAGREPELSQIKELTNCLSAKEPVSRDIILFGPRGNGKTSLLQHVAQNLNKDPTVGVVSVLARDVMDARELYMALLNTPIPVQETKTTRLGGRAGLSETGIDTKRESAKVFESSVRDLRSACVEVLNTSPKLLMVDEAHLVSQATLDAILSLASAARQGETNFAFILAGTPSLPAHISNLGASYLNRALHMRIERLDAGSARAALLLPLENAGYLICLDEHQEEELVDHTQNYPHFIQCVGHAIWDEAVASGSDEINADVVASATPTWSQNVQMMYGDRMRELERAELTGFAVALAKSFCGSLAGNLHIEHIKRIIKEANADTNAQSVTEELEELGYIWESAGGGLLFEPGIPSLMDHVLRDDQLRSELNRNRPK